MKNMLMTLGSETIDVKGIFKHSGALHLSAKLRKAVNEQSNIWRVHLDIDGTACFRSPVVGQLLEVRRAKR